MGSDLDETAADELEVLAEKLSQMQRELCSAALLLHTNAAVLANVVRKDHFAPDDLLHMKWH